MKTLTIALSTAWILAAPAQAEITLTGYQDLTIRSGDLCELEARVPDATQPPWAWTLAPAAADALTSDGSGRARFVAPFVLKATTYRVRAAYQEDPTRFKEAELVVHPPEGLEALTKEELLGKAWADPRAEYLAGTHGAKQAQDPGWDRGVYNLPFVHDCKNAALSRKWLRAGDDKIFTIGEDGKVALWSKSFRPEAPEKPHQRRRNHGSPPPLFSGVGQLAVQEPASGASGPVRVFFVEHKNHRVRWVDEDGQLGTLAGHPNTPGSLDGAAAYASFKYPQGVALGRDGAILVADTGNHTLRRISADGQVTTFAGTDGQPAQRDGKGAKAAFTMPTVLAVDHRNGDLFVLDEAVDAVAPTRIRRVTPGGEVTTLVRREDGTLGFEAWTGAAGSPRLALLDWARGLSCWLGQLYISFTPYNTVQKLDLETGVLTTLLRDLGGTDQSRTGPLEGPGRAFLRAPCAVGFNREGACAVATMTAVYSLFLEGLTPPTAAFVEHKGDGKAGD
jgi:hypothetical protein